MKVNLEDLRTISILYVEDEDQLRDSTAIILSKLFKKVYTACDGVEAIEVFKANKKDIDAIVSDINMPNLSGIEMAKQILKDQFIPIIFITAYTDDEFLRESINLNIDQYLMKPIKIKILTEKIIKSVRKYKSDLQKQQFINSLATKTKDYKELNKSLTQENIIYKNELILLRQLANKYICRIDMDKNAKILDVSNKFNKLFAYTDDEVIGESISIIEDQNDHANKMQKIMLDVIHTKKSITFTHKFLSKDKKPMAFEVLISSNFDDNSYVSGYTLYMDLIVT